MSRNLHSCSECVLRLRDGIYCATCMRARHLHTRCSTNHANFRSARPERGRAIAQRVLSRCCVVGMSYTFHIKGNNQTRCYTN